MYIKDGWKCNIEELIIKSGLRKDFIVDKIDSSTRQLRKYEKAEVFIPMKKALILAELINTRLPCTIADFYERIVEEGE